MFKKLAKRNQMINQLKKDCFTARAALIGIVNGNKSEVDFCCIELSYYVKDCMIDAWKVESKPENTYCVIGPKIKYCFGFDPKHVLERPCGHTSCPMYKKYERYVNAYIKLKAVKDKTR